MKTICLFAVCVALSLSSVHGQEEKKSSGRLRLEDFLAEMTAWNKKIRDADGNEIAQDEIRIARAKAMGKYYGKEISGNHTFFQLTVVEGGIRVQFMRKDDSIPVLTGMFPKERGKELSPLRRGDNVSIIGIHEKDKGFAITQIEKAKERDK